MVGPPSASRPRSDQAKALAREILARFKVTTPPVPLERIVRALGVRIQYTAFDGGLSGMAFIAQGVPVAGVNALHHPYRQRFTLAHELAHVEMHRAALTTEVHIDKGILRRDSVTATGVEPLEIEANVFAAELLMPQELLDAELAGRQIDLEEDASVIKALAKRFKVSEAAMRYRLQT
jgi:Zn-dependent peptidase ImmA (M78 family)